MKEAMKMHTISTRQLYTVYERLPFLFLPSAYIVEYELDILFTLLDGVVS